jgi:hypothetical protein
MRHAPCSIAPLVLVVPLCLQLLSCSAGATPTAPAGDEGSAGASGATQGGGAGEGGSDGTAGTAGAAGNGGEAGGVSVIPGSGDDCGDVGKVIYVVTSENVLLQFDPPTLAFTKIGKLSCPTSSGATPFSMAVDRTGTAFVLFHDGNIFRVSTKDASCTSTSFSPGQSGFDQFGMGYVSDSAGSVGETLFVIDGSNFGSNSNKGLAQVSGQGVLSQVAQFDGGLSGRTGEVTGRGDGKLFAFFVSNGSSSVAEIDKKTAHIISNEPQPLSSISAWAFAHWGGSFYLFNAQGGPSHVHKYTPGKGTVEVVKNAGYSIVGAGVSTCAPTEEPVK